MGKPVVIGVGEFLWDVLPDGKKAGGAPVNFAYHASQSGAEGWAVSAVGNDILGDELVRTAVSNGINLEVSHVNCPTGTVLVHLKDGQPEYEICEDVAWDYIPVTEKSLGLAHMAGAISFGTLAQRKRKSRETTKRLVEACPANALRVYDINLRQNFWSKELIESSLEMSNVFKINDAELEILKDIFGISDMDVERACRHIIDKWSLKMLILTGGDKFSSIFHSGGVSFISTPKVEVVDSVGAGDAFSGSFIAALLGGSSITDAHKAAVETAAYVCTQAGAWTTKRK